MVACQGGDAVVHLFGGFVGEGDGEDVPRGYAHLLDEVDNAVGEDAGFAAAWPCEN